MELNWVRICGYLDQNEPGRIDKELNDSLLVKGIN